MSAPIGLGKALKPSMKIALIGVFAATALGTNYALIDIPNVKLMDALVFIAAYLYGLDVGLGSAISIWAVYGLVNPYGVDDPLTLGFVMAGECFYALSGVGLSHTDLGRKLLDGEERRVPLPGLVISISALVAGWTILIFPSSFTIIPSFPIYPASLFLIGSGMLGMLLVYRGASIVFGVVGLQATFAYDVLTNFGSWLFKATTAYQALIIGITTGAPFAILHESSNFVFFVSVVPSAILASRRLLPRHSDPTLARSQEAIGHSIRSVTVE